MFYCQWINMNIYTVLSIASFRWWNSFALIQMIWHKIVLLIMCDEFSCFITCSFWKIWRNYYSILWFFLFLKKLDNLNHRLSFVSVTGLRQCISAYGVQILPDISTPEQCMHNDLSVLNIPDNSRKITVKPKDVHVRGACSCEKKPPFITHVSFSWNRNTL